MTVSEKFFDAFCIKNIRQVKQ